MYIVYIIKYYIHVHTCMYYGTATLRGINITDDLAYTFKYKHVYFIAINSSSYPNIQWNILRYFWLTHQERNCYRQSLNSPSPQRHRTWRSEELPIMVVLSTLTALSSLNNMNFSISYILGFSESSNKQLLDM